MILEFTTTFCEAYILRTKHPIAMTTVTFISAQLYNNVCNANIHSYPLTTREVVRKSMNHLFFIDFPEIFRN